MHRRHVLAILLGAAAGCSSQSSEPTATATSTPDEATTEPTQPTATTTPDATGTPSAEPTAEPVGVETVVADLNEVYAGLEPALETLEVEAVDLATAEARLGQVQTDIQRLREAGETDESRLQSLSDTRWVFDRLVRTFVRLDDAYALHEVLREAYAASEMTDDATTALERLSARASEAASAVQAAVTRYDTMDGFDSALDTSYEAFRGPLFRVSDTANALEPFSQGLGRAISARERYQTATESYENEAYRDAQNAFADLLNEFTDVRDWFEQADGMAGPLRPTRVRYQCDARAARLACTEYRAACREQLDGDSSAAERRREQAEQRYTECG